MYISPLFASVHSGCSWLDEHIKSFVKKYSPDVVFVKDLRPFLDKEAALYQICDGQRCNTNGFIIPLKNPKSSLINVYPNDDALTRKNCLSRMIEYWVAKRPESLLKRHVPITVQLDLDYAEYIEYSLAEADSFELCQSMEANGDKEPSARDWWILKPAMTDCGYGIRIFSTMTDLVGCLESLESEAPKSLRIDEHRIPSSLLREFVAQRYLTSILLLNGKKFHIRAYVLAIGRLQVFVYRELLALIASEVYRQPWDNTTLRSSLTNSSLQPEDLQSSSARSFWSSIPDDILPGDWKEDVFRQICQTSAEVFRAASQTATESLVLLPGCFELFALDFLIDTKGSVWLLEVNGGPAIPKEGEAGLLALGLFESITSITVRKLQGNEKPLALAEQRMIEVLNSELKRSSIREIVY
jgi:tubulin--tyrosine ligase